MNKTAIPLILLVASLSFSQAAKPTVYLEPQQGFETYIAAAIAKKGVPVDVVIDKDRAIYILRSAPVEVKSESTGGKIARCLFAYCAGIEDKGNVSVQLIELGSTKMVWAYSVNKQRGGSKNQQSMAEAIAKHFKEFLQRAPAVVAASAVTKAPAPAPPPTPVAAMAVVEPTPTAVPGIQQPANPVSQATPVVSPDESLNAARITLPTKQATSADMKIDALGVMVVLGRGTGAEITDEAPNGAAALARLHVGDVINSVDGTTVKTPMELVAELSKRSSSDKMRLGFLLRGEWQAETVIVLAH
jgi:hypothetical protein